MEKAFDPEAQREAPERTSSRPPIPINSSDDSPDNGKEEKKREVAEYGDTSTTYWKLYGAEAEINDKKLVDSLAGDTNSMLILNSLFSSIVASFIIEMYKTLLPDTGRQTVTLLSQLVQQSNSNSPSSFPPNPSPQPSKPPAIAIRMNIVMFLSLFLSMMSVLACALIQQWCREFMKYAYPRAAPHKCGRVRTYLFQGLDQFQMRRFMYGIHVFLHVSVFLFFWAISDFLYSVYPPVGLVARYSLIASLVVYTALSISPLIFSNSPYHTALTPLLRTSGILLLFLFNIIWRFLRNSTERSSRHRYFKGIRFDRTHFLLDEADKQAKQLDHYALQWLFQEDDFSDVDMDKFLEGLPGYINSRFTETKRLTEDLTTDYILTRIREHFMTCATSFDLSEEACINRVLACVNSLRLIFKTSRECPLDSEKERPHAGYIQGIIHGLNTLCEEEDPMVALRASCVRSLAFQGLLSQLTQSDGETPKRAFPLHLVPLYKFFCARDNMEGRQQPEGGEPSSEASNQLPSNESEKMWKSLLHDGSLVNLTILAKAVLSHEGAHPSSLSLCWRTLDMLLKELRIARTEVSESTLALFKKVHDETRNRVQAEERGFLVTSLLEILDTAARGRRVSMVFLDHPEYHSRADVVYGKEYLRNSDLLIAFATCLPDFVAKNPEISMIFMEDFVNHDDLWTTLQVNLWNSLRSDSPIPDKLRVFVACCTVIDVALLALEDSQMVDWRAPKFGSLAQHFEMFITHCFQGTFIGRALGFRIGLIKARFCKALLAQFSEELDREGTVFFRSQWDVASLARLFCTLEVGDEGDEEFWKYYIDGGHIGDEFMIKAREMLKIAVRDGPLLNFCKLGHLTAMAGPFDGSDLEHVDIEKLWELQRKMMADLRLPLNSASPEVWAELDRLRDEVNDISSKSTGGDKDRLNRLLGTIDEVYGLSPPATQQGSLSEHAEAEAYFASSSNAITPGRSDATPTSENGFGVPDSQGSSPTLSYSPRNNDNASNNLGSPYPTFLNSLGGGIFDGTIGTLPYMRPILRAQGNSLPVQSGNPPVNPCPPHIWGTGQHGAAPTYQPARRRSLRSRARSGPATLKGTPPTWHKNMHSLFSGAATNFPQSPYNPGDAGQMPTAPTFGSDKIE